MHMWHEQASSTCASLYPFFNTGTENALEQEESASHAVLAFQLLPLLGLAKLFDTSGGAEHLICHTETLAL